MASDVDGDRDHRPFYYGFVGAYLVLVIIAVAVDYLLYADGAYFAFSLASRHPWELLWREFPLRLGTMLVTGGPADVLAHLGAPATLVSKTYQATFLLVPLASLWLTRRIEGRTAGRWQLWLMFATITLAMMAFGFPTETFVAVALLFPVLAVVTRGISDLAQLALAMTLSTLFLFSHEIAPLCAPAMLVALYLAGKQPGSDRRYLAALLAWWIINAAVWLYLKRFFIPENRMLVPALAQNQTAFLDFHQILERPIQRFGLVATAVLMWLSWRPQDSRHLVVKLVAVAIAVWGAVTCLPDTWGADHYYCRKAIGLALPVVGIAALLVRTPTRDAGRIALLFFGVQVGVASYNVFCWTQYKHLLVDQLSKRAMVNTGDWDAFNQAQLPVHAKGFHWNWAEPYLTALLTLDDPNSAILIDNETWYVPLTCATATRVLPGIPWLARDRSDRILSDVCDKSVTLEPFCRGTLAAKDVDGDGRVDLVCTGKGHVEIRFAVASGIRTARQWLAPLPWCDTPTSRLLVGDFDGDGRADLLCHDQFTGQQQIAFAHADGTFAAATWPGALKKPWCAGESSELLAGDFDGDRHADLLCHDRKTGSLVARLARGGAEDFAFVDGWSDVHAAWCNDEGNRLVVADVDGDRLDDLICHRPSGGATWVAFDHWDQRATAPALSFGLHDWEVVSAWCTGASDSYWVHDFDGDGFADMACQSPDGYRWIAKGTGSRTAPYGGTTQIRYGNGWCYGGESRDRHHRMLVNVACVANARGVSRAPTW